MANDTLEKNWKSALLGGVLGAGLLANNSIGHEPALPKPIVQPKVDSPWSTTGLHPDLLPIAFLESSGGKFTQHQPHSGGPYYTAFGSVGLKPVSAHDYYLKNKQVQAKYPDLSDKDKFTQKLKTDPKFYNEMASDLWTQNANKFKNSLPHAVYAWRHGRKAAIDAGKETVQNDPYVKSYLGYQSKQKDMIPKVKAVKAPEHPKGMTCSDGQCSVPSHYDPVAAAKYEESLGLNKSLTEGMLFDIYISWALEEVEVEAQLYAKEGNTLALRNLEDKIKDANQLWESFCLRTMGEVICVGGISDVGRILLHQDSLDELPTIKSEIEAIFDSPVSIGAGRDLKESDQALYICAKETPGKIVFYTQEIAYKIKLISDSMAKSENAPAAQAKEDAQAKKRNWKQAFSAHVTTADPSKNSNWHKTGSFRGKTHAGFIHAKAGGDVPSVHKPKAPEHTPERVAGLRKPKDILNDLTNLSAKGSGKPKEDIEGIKKKIVKLLENLKSEELEQLKIANPDAYATILKLIGAITSIGRALPEAPRESNEDWVPPPAPAQVAKTEDVNIVQAAFLDNTSKVVYGTGSCHDINYLPTEYNEKTYTEGFLTDENEFVSREEAGGLRSEDVFKTNDSKEFLANLNKGGIKLPSIKVKRFIRPSYPIGTEKQNGLGVLEIKVQHLGPQGEPGEIGWNKIGSGKIMGSDGHPISSQNQRAK